MSEVIALMEEFGTSVLQPSAVAGIALLLSSLSWRCGGPAPIRPIAGGWRRLPPWAMW